MKRVGSVVFSAILLMALIGGCGPAKDSSRQPEQIIDLVLEQCRAGEYEAASQHFEGGPGMWKNQPQFVRDFVDRLCAVGEAKHFKVRDRQERNEDLVLIQITTYKDAELKEGLRTMTWQFARQGQRWLITKVE